MSRRKKRGENLRLGILFVALVGILVLMSLAFKVADLLRASRFDSANNFNLLVLKENPQVLSFSPKNSSIFILSTKDYKYKDLGRSLLVPIDGRLEEELEFKKESLTGNLLSLLIKNSPAKADQPLAEKSNLTIIDIIRLAYFTRGVDEKQKTERTILGDSTPLEVQSIIQSYFSDPKIISEKQRIEIVNATDTPGLANKLATYITNMGGNVILISTSDSAKQNSEIKYFDQRTYTVSKLKGLLGFKDIKEKKKGISDVIIIIGKDKVGELPF